jgi:hypothetical protein
VSIALVLVAVQGNFYYQGRSAFGHSNLDLTQLERLAVMLQQQLALPSRAPRVPLFRVLVEIHSRCRGKCFEDAEL